MKSKKKLVAVMDWNRKWKWHPESLLIAVLIGIIGTPFLLSFFPDEVNFVHGFLLTLGYVVSPVVYLLIIDGLLHFLAILFGPRKVIEVEE